MHVCVRASVLEAAAASKQTWLRDGVPNNKPISFIQQNGSVGILSATHDREAKNTDLVIDYKWYNVWANRRRNAGKTCNEVIFLVHFYLIWPQWLIAPDTSTIVT